MKQFPDVLYVVIDGDDDEDNATLMCDPDVGRIALVDQEVRVGKYMLIEEGFVFAHARYQKGTHK